MKRFRLWQELFVQFFWLVFLIVLVWEYDGRILAASFLNPKYFWLLYVSIVFFAAFMSNTLIKILSEQDDEGSAPIFLYLLIPLLMFPAALKAQLGADAVERRGLVFSEVQESEQAIQDELIFRNTDGTDRFSDILGNPRQSVGRPVNLIGRAALNPILPDGSFYFYRFIIYCCAADANPGGLIVTGIDTSAVEVDGWYRINGTVGTTAVDDKNYLSLEAAGIERVAEPEIPFEDYWAFPTE